MKYKRGNRKGDNNIFELYPFNFVFQQPEDEAHVAILSTCPCERDLHYVITTDGRVTDWAQRRYEDTIPPAKSTSAAAVCRLNFR